NKTGVGRNGLPPPNMGKGRMKGSPNKVTRVLKDAILLAAEQVGEDQKGKDGLIGYLRGIAKVHPTTFAGLLARIIPLQYAEEMKLGYDPELLRELSDKDLEKLVEISKRLQQVSISRAVAEI